jgi:IS5 family transposase
LGSTGQVTAPAKRFSQEIVQGVKRSSDVLQQAALEGMKREIDTMLPRVKVKQVVSQTRARIIHGITDSAGKIVSLFEHTTEIIRKGKPGKPTEFGKMIKVQEAENRRIFLRCQRKAAEKLGVARVAVPFPGTQSAQRRQRQKERWFRKARRWRIGCEGRISVLKRRHGLRRCLYKGDVGMHSWVGLGVVADNLINIGKVLAARLTPKKSASDAL